MFSYSYALPAVSVSAHFAGLTGSVSGTWVAETDSPRPVSFPPLSPQAAAHHGPCSEASPVIWDCLTSHVLSSLSCSLGIHSADLSQGGQARRPGIHPGQSGRPVRQDEGRRGAGGGGRGGGDAPPVAQGRLCFRPPFAAGRRRDRPATALPARRAPQRGRVVPVRLARLPRQLEEARRAGGRRGGLHQRQALPKIFGWQGRGRENPAVPTSTARTVLSPFMPVDSQTRPGRRRRAAPADEVAAAPFRHPPHVAAFPRPHHTTAQRAGPA